MCCTAEINIINQLYFKKINVKEHTVKSVLVTFCHCKSEVAQSCLALCDPMDYSLLGSSIYGTFQARILEWVGISFSRISSQPRDWTRVSHIVGRCFTLWATREAPHRVLWSSDKTLHRRRLPSIQSGIYERLNVYFLFLLF